MTDGERMLDLARTRLGEKYVNVCVPKNNPNWHGPWDCAEFMSWLVYQIGGYLYGCVDNEGNPALIEAYTGAWQSDSKKLGKRIPWEEAAATAGAILLRYPPTAGAMGHIVVSDGKGGTVEAMGKKWGVVEGKIAKRNWDTGVLLPNFTYRGKGAALTFPSMPQVYGYGRPEMKATVVRSIQEALKGAGFDPGPIDGEFTTLTSAAVAAFQTVKGIVVDGQVGPQTARLLKVDLKA